jgi:hypothetical protein
MKRLITIIATAALLAGMDASAAKQGFNEGFTNNLDGWTSYAGGSGSPWYWSGGTAYNEGAAFPNGQAWLVASNRLNMSSNFIGNYVSADIRVLSFWFRSDVQQPSYLSVRLLSADNAYLHSISFTNAQQYTTGRWYQVILPLETLAEAGWNPINPTDDTGFGRSKTNVTQLIFEVNPTALTSDIKLDNIALDRITRAAAVAAASNGTLVTWRWVRTNYPYKVQSATNIVSPVWTNFMTWTPTNRDMPVLITNRPDASMFYRLSE